MDIISKSTFMELVIEELVEVPGFRVITSTEDGKWVFMLYYEGDLKIKWLKSRFEGPLRCYRPGEFERQTVDVIFEMVKEAKRAISEVDIEELTDKVDMIL